MRTFTEEELAMIAQAGLTVEEVDQVLTMFPQDVVTAVGHIVALKAGMGQERNKSFQDQAEANADVSGQVENANEAGLSGGDASQT